jgi:hypothetical protein
MCGGLDWSHTVVEAGRERKTDVMGSWERNQRKAEENRRGRLTHFLLRIVEICSHWVLAAGAHRCWVVCARCVVTSGLRCHGGATTILAESEDLGVKLQAMS